FKWLVRYEYSKRPCSISSPYKWLCTTNSRTQEAQKDTKGTNKTCPRLFLCFLCSLLCLLCSVPDPVGQSHVDLVCVFDWNENQILVPTFWQCDGGENLGQFSVE